MIIDQFFVFLIDKIEKSSIKLQFGQLFTRFFVKKYAKSLIFCYFFQFFSWKFPNFSLILGVYNPPQGPALGVDPGWPPKKGGPRPPLGRGLDPPFWEVPDPLFWGSQTPSFGGPGPPLCGVSWGIWEAVRRARKWPPEGLTTAVPRDWVSKRAPIGKKTRNPRKSSSNRGPKPRGFWIPPL